MTIKDFIYRFGKEMDYGRFKYMYFLSACIASVVVTPLFALPVGLIVYYYFFYDEK